MSFVQISSQESDVIASIIILILQMRKRRFKEIKELAPVHEAKRQKPGIEPRLSDPRIHYDQPQPSSPANPTHAACLRPFLSLK